MCNFFYVFLLYGNFFKEERTEKNYLKLMAEISSENGTKAFNYTRNTKNVLNISCLALLLSLAKSSVFNRRNKHTMHCGTSMHTSPYLVVARTRHILARER